MAERATIYLAPSCCYDEMTGRVWCEDDVWPCTDCPDKYKKSPPRGIRYALDKRFIRKTEKADGPR